MERPTRRGRPRKYATAQDKVTADTQRKVLLLGFSRHLPAAMPGKQPTAEALRMFIRYAPLRQRHLAFGQPSPDFPLFLLKPLSTSACQPL